MIKFHREYFTENKPFDQAHQHRTKQPKSQYKKKEGMESKLTRFQIYPGTESACKYWNTLCKTQCSDMLVEYRNQFYMETGKLIIPENATNRNRDDEKS